jgi:hypothetical protein
MWSDLQMKCGGLNRAQTLLYLAASAPELPILVCDSLSESSCIDTNVLIDTFA